MANIGIITEQGDLGLGFDDLNEKDQKSYNEAMKQQQNNDRNTTVINETNKN